MTKYIIATSGEEVAHVPNDAALLLSPDGSEVATGAPHLGSYSAIFVYLNSNELISNAQAQQALAKSISALNSYIVTDHVKLCQEKARQLSSKLTGANINAEEIIANVCFIVQLFWITEQ